MSVGKKVRIERLLNRKSGKTIMVPMDHGVSAGPMQGLVDMPETVNHVAEGGANAVILHKGMVGRGHRGGGEESSRDIGLIVHMSASTDVDEKNSLSKRLVCTVEEAIKLGADGVSVHVNLGPETEGAMLEDMGRVAERCDFWGMPLLAMVYPRYFDESKPAGQRVVHNTSPETIAHAARVAAELGADIVKVPFVGEAEDFRKVVEGAGIPVVIAGGSKIPADKLLESVDKAMQAGAAGLSVGRNVFQAPDPARILRAFGAIVHEGMTAGIALKLLQ